MKTATANSFVATSILCTCIAGILYCFLGNILSWFPLKTGTINYTVFASKIWFVSSPFIGLEIVIFSYFKELDYYSSPIKVVLLKLLVYLILCFILYFNRDVNCLVYAKPLCDIIFLPMLTRICFDLTLK